MNRAWNPTSPFFMLAVGVVFLSIIPAAAAQTAAPVSGADVYQKRCAMCHDQVGNRAPSREALQKMPAVRILRTLDFGLMMGIAYPIKRQEREAVANYLGTPGGDPPPAASSFCSSGMVPLAGSTKANWAGWSQRNALRRQRRRPCPGSGRENRLSALGISSQRTCSRGHCPCSKWF